MIHSLLKESYFARIIALLVLFLALYLANHLLSMNYDNSREMQMRLAVVHTLGGLAMPIISQCGTSRNLSEGIYARRGDLPGGPCFHADCNVTAPPGGIAERAYTLEVRQGNP
jgi:hypothetical protein